MFSVFIPMDFPWVLLIGSPGLIFHLPDNCVSINTLFILPKTVQNCGDSKTYPICKVKVSPLHFVDAVRRHGPPRTKTEESITSVVVARVSDSCCISSINSYF